MNVDSPKSVCHQCEIVSGAEFERWLRCECLSSMDGMKVLMEAFSYLLPPTISCKDMESLPQEADLSPQQIP